METRPYFPAAAPLCLAPSLATFAAAPLGNPMPRLDYMQMPPILPTQTPRQLTPITWDRDNEAKMRDCVLNCCGCCRCCCWELKGHTYTHRPYIYRYMTRGLRCNPHGNASILPRCGAPAPRPVTGDFCHNAPRKFDAPPRLHANAFNSAYSDTAPWSKSSSAMTWRALSYVTAATEELKAHSGLLSLAPSRTHCAAAEELKAHSRFHSLAAVINCSTVRRSLSL